MLRIGLTGGLASGKSTVASILGELGAAVFDADRFVAQLYEPGGAGEAVVKELFGSAVEEEGSAVDRSKIARVVFGDPAARRSLEARIHPLVREEIERLFREAEKLGFAVAVAEASQLLEAGTEDRYDRVLLVVAPEAERIRRWSEKGRDPVDARRRMAGQLSAEHARPRVTDVIVNDGSLEELRSKVEAVFRDWTT
ncbi:MAG: dephospho-CoA kinase [Acidobacteriota bacterium]|nr:dephospho-CoA kinase [Acidobacteriota bacterium]MDQ5871744.1 dephospho-CoA kinase [Acidobacteriota bacterium]